MSAVRPAAINGNGSDETNRIVLNRDPIKGIS
jgi:hypothetical protein